MNWQHKSGGGNYVRRAEKRARRRLGTRSKNGQTLTPYTKAWRKNLRVRDAFFQLRGERTPFWLRIWPAGVIA